MECAGGQALNNSAGFATVECIGAILGARAAHAHLWHTGQEARGTWGCLWARAVQARLTCDWCRQAGRNLAPEEQAKDRWQQAMALLGGK